MKNSIQFYKDKTLVAEKNSFGWLLRLLYKTHIGKIIRIFLTKKYSSILVGWFYTSPLSRFLIQPFIKKYKIAIADFIIPANGYKTFNDFFIRAVKPEARPISSAYAVAAADSKIYVINNITNQCQFFIKSAPFVIDTFLDKAAALRFFSKADLIVFRLAPYDYHRFHFPFDCIPQTSIVIDGTLETVNPISFKTGLMPLTTNKRVIIPLQKNTGEVWFLVAVGALFVGSIVTTYTPHKFYKKGDEAGYFQFGGSTVVLLAPAGEVIIRNDIFCHSAEHIETAVLMGESIVESS